MCKVSGLAVMHQAIVQSNEYEASKAYVKTYKKISTSISPQLINKATAGNKKLIINAVLVIVCRFTF